LESAAGFRQSGGTSELSVFTIAETDRLLIDLRELTGLRSGKAMSTDDKAIKQDFLPFPPTPSASIAGRTMQESVYKRRVEPRRLPVGSPNILILLIDDAGPGSRRPSGAAPKPQPWTASSRKGSLTTVSTRQLCARPHGRPC
jgi:hypothetical protein